ncbi:PKD domain-containing protein, partial [Lentimicrobium sp. S6]|uniref:PKD domain-containing protein n=1 Tax=Lentimicrobium sp. S6 TaxID=2735872 RepID=UPI0015560CE7
EVALGTPVDFTDLSTLNGGAAIVSWEWDFDDPASGTDNTSTLQNPSHTYDILGDFQVSLTVTDGNGCSHNYTAGLGVNPPPASNFSFTPACFGFDVEFTDLSTTSEGSITNWWWDFGDPASANNTSTEKDPTHLFTAPGTYTVELKTKAFGFNTITKEITVYQNPEAAFNSSTPCQGDAMQLTDATVLGDAAINSWSWDFADGNTSTQSNPSHTYTAAGDYMTTFTVTDENGCTHSTSQNVKVWENPTASFNTNSACVKNLTEFSDISLDGDASITAWQWTFGEASSGILNESTSQNPSHEYALPGSYDVSFQVTDANTCVNTRTASVTITPAPVANFTSNALCFGEDINFSDQSVTSNGNIIAWNWQMGDGFTYSSENPTHQYTSPGDKDIRLIATDNLNCVDTMDKTLYVTPDFTLDIAAFELCSNTPASLSGEVVDPLLTPDTWSWTFADGQSASGQSV